MTTQPTPLQHWYGSNWYSSEPLAHGGFSVIYPVSSKHVGKIRKKHLDQLAHSLAEELSPEILRNLEGMQDYFEAMEKLKHEHEIHAELYRGGVQVPKPEGIFNLHLEGRLDRLFGRRNFVLPSIVMQRIYGIPSNSPEVMPFFQNVHDQFCEELEKVRRLGFVPGIDHGSNILFDPKEQKLYLIDFESWVRR